ncbi:unnamed protein product [Blepharisma stoltei]|uniref:Cyclic nucleotide-binding domain-containing protein n=1 Tax=Blepharisma stoltei TaxID=1481888 RepID=A0AAU9J0M2_9CILI|nr:unnamed protein product [Blepharisma stoltei]
MKEYNRTRETSPGITRTWQTLSILNHVQLLELHEPESLKNFERAKKRKTEIFFHIKESGNLEKSHQIIKVFDPENFLRVVWDVLILAITTYQCIIIPFILSFNPMPNHAVLSSIFTTEILYSIDVFIQLNTAYYLYGEYIISRKSISLNYMKSWFILDFLTLSPNFMFFLEDIFEPDEEIQLKDILTSKILNYIWLLKLARIAKMKKIMYLVEDSLSSPKFIAIAQIGKFFLVAILWAHWISCITYVFYKDALLHYGELWASRKEFVSDRYLFMLFYAVLTMTSCGYGSFFISSPLQMINAMTTMFFECFLFGYLIGNLQTIIGKQTAKSKYWENVQDQLRKFMYRKNVPKLLRGRISEYITYLKRSSKNKFNDEELLKCLSAQLKDEIYIQTRGQSLNDCPAFGIYATSFLRALGRNLEIKVHAPGDLLFKEGEMSNDVYFLQSGTVEIYHESTRTVFKELKKGKYFGEISFFLDSIRSASARCLVYSELLSLSRSALMRMFISRPREREITELLIKECKEDLSALGVRCYLCATLGHIARDCDLYKFQLDRSKIAQMADKDKYRWGTYINLNDRLIKKIERKRKITNHFEHFSLQNIIGKNEPKFKRESMAEKAEKLYVEKDLNKSSSKLALIQDESEEEVDQQTALPASMRYREMFLINSLKNRTNKQISVNVPDLSYIAGDQFGDLEDSPY